MFYYEKYSPVILFGSMAILSIVIILLFRKKISSLIDPLLLHLIWCASSLALLFGYFRKVGPNVDGLLFVAVYVFYLTGLYFFSSSKAANYEILTKELYHHKNTKLFLLCLGLNIASRYEFFSYALSSSSIVEWFLYRFKQVEGRNVVQYILQLGARPFFLYYTFILLKTKPSWRWYVSIILIFNVLLDVVAGGRSSMISLMLAFGFFVYRFSPFFSKQRVRKLNIYGVLAVLVALTIGSAVTSLYQKDSTFEDGVLSMGNRLLAAGDGLEMYLTNNGSVFIKSGVGEYIKSVFGIFIKRVVDIQTQSVGWQLYELENGIVVPFAVGPNYILPLQAFVLGKLYIVPYCLFIGFIVAFLRGNQLTKALIKNQPLSFVLGLLSFEPALDIELFVLSLLGCLFVFYCFIFPFRKLTLINDYSTSFVKLKMSLKYD